jgi:hypothetical protein
MACVTKKKGKPGRWCIDFYDQHGKRRLKVLPEGTTKAEARDVLRDIEDQVGKSMFMPTKQVPTFSGVARDWIEHKRLNLRETTWEIYEGHVHQDQTRRWYQYCDSQKGSYLSGSDTELCGTPQVYRPQPLEGC